MAFMEHQINEFKHVSFVCTEMWAKYGFILECSKAVFRLGYWSKPLMGKKTQMLHLLFVSYSSVSRVARFCTQCLCIANTAVNLIPTHQPRGKRIDGMSSSWNGILVKPGDLQISQKSQMKE